MGTGTLQMPGLTRSTGGSGPTVRALTDTTGSARRDQAPSALDDVTGGDAGPVHQLGRRARAGGAPDGQMGDAWGVRLVRQRLHDRGPDTALRIVVLDDEQTTRSDPRRLAQCVYVIGI